MHEHVKAHAAGETVTHASLLKIAVPITLSNATVPLIGYVDTAVIGQLGQAHLIGAVGIGGVIFSVLYWTFSFLRMGTTGLTAQAYGARDGREIAGHLLRALGVAVFFGVVLVILQGPIAKTAFWLIGPSREAEAAAQTYFSIRIWAAPAGLVNFALLGWYIGLGRAGVAFVVQLVINVLNMALAMLFVLWLGGGVAGVGYAALIAECAGAVLGLVIALRIAREMGASAPLADGLDWLKMKRSLGINADLTVRAVGHYSAIMFFTAQGAAGGDVILAANAILMTLINIMVYLLDGFAFAAESLVGRAVGARDKRSFWRAVLLSTEWAGVLAVLIGGGLWFAGPAIIELTAKSAEVQQAAGTYLMWAAIAPMLGVWCFQLDGIFTGATRTRDMRNTMVLSLIPFFAVWCLLAPHFGNHGLWAAFMVFYVARASSLLAFMPALVRASFPEKV
ncbi:MATE family efflux transporter [Hyphomicrobium sp. CS1BSMeth3]|uniref:MATE family efflux transporter n=1 Tax=Hyphomicrobium sp. CS1BSMeth3 TaxID=1892844 RepID=UPI000931856D|nr:MATE family efflux transporter [Hyphomicrobium sp. CS1BSMeth3]